MKNERSIEGESLSRDEVGDLQGKLEERRVTQMNESAKVKDRASIKKEELEERKKRLNLDKAISGRRGVVQQNFWTILKLIDGTYDIAEGINKRQQPVTAYRLLHENEMISQYNKRNIVMVDSIHFTLQEAQHRIKVLAEDLKNATLFNIIKGGGTTNVEVQKSDKELKQSQDVIKYMRQIVNRLDKLSKNVGKTK